MTNLEQSFADLAVRHDLLNCGLDYHRGERTFFHFSMQWSDPSDTYHGRGIATGSGDTIAEAVDHAMQVLAVKRAVAFADEALPGLVA